MGPVFSLGFLEGQGGILTARSLEALIGKVIKISELKCVCLTYSYKGLALLLVWSQEKSFSQAGSKPDMRCFESIDVGRFGDVLGDSTSSPTLLSLFCLFSRVKNELNLFWEAFRFCSEHLEFTEFAIFHIPSTNAGKLLSVPCMIP